jgi:hypothetical protein
MKTLKICALILFIASCENGNKTNISKADEPNSATTITAPIVGNDIDEHGCKGSAGFQYSILRNDCIRIFETGIRLNAVAKDVDTTFSAFIVFKTDNKNSGATDSLELFMPNQKASIILKASNDEIINWNNENYKIVKDALDYKLLNIKGEILYRTNN